MFSVRPILLVLICISCLMSGSNASRAQTIHAILVTDTLDGSIGAGIAENLKNIKSFLQTVQSIAQLNVMTTEVTGANFNCKSIVTALGDLDVSSNDTVFFYYSGHGFRIDNAAPGSNEASKTKFPEFDCNRTADPDKMGLSTAVTSIQANRPRLIIAIADTCNKPIGPFAAPAEAPAAAPPEASRKAGLLHLFKDYGGTLIMSGAVPGEFSWYMSAGAPLGGFFTNQLLQTINQNINSNGANVRWESIATDATQPIFVPANPPATQDPQYAALNLSVIGLNPASSQESQDEINPADLRRFWIGDIQPQAAAPPYVLTSQERSRFAGTYGVDLSHYTFDISSAISCKTQQAYSDPACSCVADWRALSDNGVRYVYSKASDGSGVDLSFAKVWSGLEAQHTAKVIFRGAYHFLRPGVDVDKQADVFLQAVGAVDGKKPSQLSPVLDIEWSNKQVVPGTSEFVACPASRRTQNDQGKYYCDMWSVLPPATIAAMAKRWIDRVEQATGLPVTIYTNPTAWWNAVMTLNEDAILKNRAVWTSRYTSSGPEYDPRWTALGGSPKWKMAPLPRGAAYPQNSYSIPHFWQFTEIGNLPSNFLTCNGQSARKSVDMNFVPVSGSDYPITYSINRN